MGEYPASKGPLSWAEICLSKDRLRQLAKESGRLLEWRELDQLSQEQKDTLEEWTELWNAVAMARTGANGYTVRGKDDHGPTVAYSCPSARKCGRTVLTEPKDAAPECRLARKPMTRDEGR